MYYYIWQRAHVWRSSILAGGLSLIYGLGWYKDRKHKRRINRRVKAINQLPVTPQATKLTN